MLGECLTCLCAVAAAAAWLAASNNYYSTMAELLARGEALAVRAEAREEAARAKRRKKKGDEIDGA